MSAILKTCPACKGEVITGVVGHRLWPQHECPVVAERDRLLVRLARVEAAVRCSEGHYCRIVEGGLGGARRGIFFVCEECGTEARMVTQGGQLPPRPLWDDAVDRLVKDDQTGKARVEDEDGNVIGEQG